MGLLKLNVKNLVEFDQGRLAAAIELALKQCVADCQDRPGLDSARKVKIELKLTPEIDHTGELIAIDAHYSVAPILPPRSKGGCGLGVQKNGDLVFSTVATDNAAQMDLIDDDRAK